MKKGNLTKKGKYWHITSSEIKSGNIMVPGDFGLTDDMAGKEVEFDNSIGPVTLIFFNKKKYVKKQEPTSSHHGNNPPHNTPNMNATGQQIGNAHAPYNFIPLSEKVVNSPIRSGKVNFNTYETDKLSGEIITNISSVTPLFIRGMRKLTDPENKKSPFFFEGKDICIPGSSFRGLLRTLIEIASYSKMGSMNEDLYHKRFHYRAFADKSVTLKNAYTQKMLGRDYHPDAIYPLAKAGIISKKGLEFVVHEAEHYKVEESDAIAAGIINQTMSLNNRITGRYEKNDNYQQAFKEVWFTPTAKLMQTSRHTKPLKYALVTSLSNTRQPGMTRGFIVCSGWMVGSRARPIGKHMHWIVGNINYTKENIIPQDVISNYREDISRDGMDLLAELDKPTNNEVPCFYITDGSNRIISFGHTGMFRLAYDNVLMDFFPSEHKKWTEPDFTNSLFGDLNNGPTRVFFEDALMTEGELSTELKIPAILGSPKPTTFQHYLTQDKHKIQAEYNSHDKVSGFSGLNDYNCATNISGYKWYWHLKKIEFPEEIEFKGKSFKDYLNKQSLLNLFSAELRDNRVSLGIRQLNPDQSKAVCDYILSQPDVQHTVIKPVLEKANFIGRIRFENLTKEELGAILFFLNLDEKLHLKLGMGKGLGFGSIRVSSKLLLSTRKSRYAELISEWTGFDQNRQSADKNTVDDYIKSFEKYILTEIGSRAVSLWNENRMKELKTMMDIDKAPTGLKAKYMQIRDANRNNEYKERPILQKPSEYLNTL